MDLLVRLGLKVSVRLLGVGVTNIVRQSQGQLSLFEPAERNAQRGRLNQAIDEIAQRFGSEALTRGSQEGARRAGLSLQIKRGEIEDSKL
jgi:hypothetical protein